MVISGWVNWHVSAQASSDSNPDLARQVEKARSVVRKVDEGFKIELTRAKKAGGLVAAIGAYHAAAPEILSRQSVASGFEVRRTALKLRNQENEPADWESKVLQAFLEKNKDRAGNDKLEYYEIVRAPGGDRRFRYMRAIIASDSCLDCHGGDMKREVQSEIAKYYADDKSKGFKEGDVIGAYSLVKIIE